jgi:hypothetical protein
MQSHIHWTAVPVLTGQRVRLDTAHDCTKHAHVARRPLFTPSLFTPHQLDRTNLDVRARHQSDTPGPQFVSSGGLTRDPRRRVLVSFTI